jgi:arylsulfatase A-like enzyme
VSTRRAPSGIAVGVVAAIAAIVGIGVVVTQQNRPPGPPPKVILVTIDTCRADHLPMYGYHRDTTPFLAELASNGVLFENASSVSSWTPPSMASVLTGLYPVQHGVVDTAHDNGTGTFVEPAIHQDVTTLGERFKALGYATFASVTNLHVSNELGYSQGFDVFEHHGWSSGEAVHDAVVAMAPRIAQAEKSFLWVHFFDPHMPYDAREPWVYEFDEESGERFAAMARETPEQRRERIEKYDGFDLEDIPSLPKAGTNPVPIETLRNLYDSELRDTDEWIRKVVTLVDPKREALVFVTADHGEEFRDHGKLGHRTSLMPELTHVPMLVSAPGRLEPGRRVSGPVSLIDVVPTLLDAVGGTIAEPLPGRSLWPFAQSGDPVPGRDLLLDVHNRRGITQGIVRYPKKLVQGHDGALRYVDLSVDPTEKTNLAAAQPAEAQALLEAMKTEIAALPPVPKTEVTATAGTVELLQQIGYVDGEAQPNAGGEGGEDDSEP